MRFSRLVFFAPLALLCFVPACGDQFSADGDGGSSDDAGLDATPIEPDDGGDGAARDGVADTSIDTSHDSMPDTKTSDSPGDACATSQPNVADGVFVAVGGASGTCGTEAAPCGSIGDAITVATGAGKHVIYIAEGTYAEQITLAPGITLQGGWTNAGSVWSRDCSLDATKTIVQPTSATSAVLASFNGTATLDDLSVKSKATAAAGESLYGIFATGATTHLVLTNVNVQAFAGGRGSDGGSGTAGTAGSVSGCDPATASDSGNGGTGSAGPGGANATYSASGASAQAGSTGGTATAGHNGAAGGVGPCTSQPSGCSYNVAMHTCVYGGNVLVCGFQGRAGCGGTGGTGGLGATGGGSSIAVFAWDAHVDATGGVFASGDGGRGGDGGGGGGAGPGGAGAQGNQSSSTYQTSCTYVGGIQLCNSTSAHEGGGTAGTTGGAGGVGGQGGGGAGGDSYAYYTGPTAQVTATGTTLTPGVGGTPGNGGTPPSGHAAPHN